MQEFTQYVEFTHERAIKEQQLENKIGSTLSKVDGAGGVNHLLEAALQEQKKSKGKNKYDNNPETEQKAPGDH